MSNEEPVIALTECPLCKGTGSDLYTGEDCPDCAGRGFVLQAYLNGKILPTDEYEGKEDNND